MEDASERGRAQDSEGAAGVQWRSLGSSLRQTLGSLVEQLCELVVAALQRCGQAFMGSYVNLLWRHSSDVARRGVCSALHARQPHSALKATGELASLLALAGGSTQ